MERKWEDLETDCLVHIFGKLEIEDMILGVPFVCKNWYKASLNPLSWQNLDFTTLNFSHLSPFATKFKRLYCTESYSFAGLMKLAINRGRQSVTKLSFPGVCALNVLTYASDMCPNLKFIRTPMWIAEDLESPIPPLHVEQLEPFFKLFETWKDLEYLYIREKLAGIDKVLHEISCHCKNFSGIKKTGRVYDEEAHAIVNYVPRVKHFTFTSASMSRENLMMIIHSCRGLEELIVNDCCGFVVDEEILNSASHINKLELENIRLEEDELFYNPHLFHASSAESDDNESDDDSVVDFYTFISS